MDSIDRLHRRTDGDNDHSPYDHPHNTAKLAQPRCPTRQPRPDRMPAEDPSGYTLMVAGRRTGKTSFLRLLLDTCNLSSTVTRDQLANVAKFVQGCSGHTAHIRTVSIDIDLAPEDTDEELPLCLTLIDTPSLDLHDEPKAQGTVQDILRHVEGRLGECFEDVSALRSLLKRPYKPDAAARVSGTSSTVWRPPCTSVSSLISFLVHRFASTIMHLSDCLQEKAEFASTSRVCRTGPSLIGRRYVLHVPPISAVKPEQVYSAE